MKERMGQGEGSQPAGQGGEAGRGATRGCASSREGPPSAHACTRTMHTRARTHAQSALLPRGASRPQASFLGSEGTSSQPAVQLGGGGGYCLAAALLTIWAPNPTSPPPALGTPGDPAKL